ncbi:hypothetical protein FRD01_10820 [Microvenator marinus]|uniref:Uncharacterized protein n=1 Tax=Microvenator marinus TaxID=2600177 RepID=A0A5B8XVF1_9DELT|nr:hypothetical protein [Microvenator marinus]QED27716.1 hypothetical protein FRD01_10820 [Microvenator marinus]
MIPVNFARLCVLTAALVGLIACGGGTSEDTDMDFGVTEDMPTNDMTQQDMNEADMAEPDQDAPDQSDMNEADMPEDMDPPGPIDWPDSVIRIPLDANGRGQATANYADFPALENIDFLMSPGIACYQNATRNEYFTGNHLMFVIDAPVDEWSEVRITATPVGNAEAAIYAITQDDDGYFVPPEITESRFCHFPVTFGGPGAAGELTFRTYPSGSQNVFIGVSNRGRFAGDTNSDVTVEVEVVSLSGQDRCYDEVPSPARWPNHVQRIELDSEGSATLNGSLTQGALPCSLDFVEDTTCAPATRTDRFEGNHVFYALDQPIPPNSILTVTAVPDPGVDISLYGASQGSGTGFEIPTGFPVANCEASYDNRPGTSRNPGDAESLSFVALQNGYNVFVGVAGDAVQGSSGGYTLSFNLITWSTNDCTDADYSAVTDLSAWPSDVTILDSNQSSQTVQATLGNGRVPCTLDWADDSHNACFPATRFSFFRGATDFYALDPPPPAGSRIRVRAIPDPGVEVSLFGFRNGPEDYVLPPLVNGLVQCEASYTFGIGEVPNPGETEFIQFVGGSNQYGYTFGVAAYNDGSGGPDIMTGDYRLEVEIDTPPPPHCPQSLPGAAYPTWPAFVDVITLDANGDGSTTGNLADGSCVNLDWAERSDVACFPATQFERFEGNHTFFTLDEPIPPRSELVVTVTPQNNADVNVYAFIMGDYEHILPPNVTNTACRTSYSLQGPNPGEVETIRIQNPTENAMYNVMIGVAGDAQTGQSGAFTVDANLEVAQTFCPQSLPGPTNLSDWPAGVTELSLNGQGIHQSTGNLNTGACTNLDFAADSAVACFPETRFDRFDGNQNFYAVAQPMPPNSTLTISVNPDDGVDLSLYGFQLGATEYVVPPNVPSAICEASYALGVPNPGAGESITFYNPSDTASYNVFFAVAGANGATDGGYQIQMIGQQGQIHCEDSLPGTFYQNWPGSVNLLTLDSNLEATTTGNLSSGQCTNLAFAAASSVACFPAVDFDAYEGNHVYYALRDPLPPGKQARVTLTPSAGANISLYGYTIGNYEFYVPPAVPSALCEADFGATSGVRQIQFNTGNGDPYNFFFAAAGPNGVNSGAYQIEVEVFDP